MFTHCWDCCIIRQRYETVKYWIPAVPSRIHGFICIPGPCITNVIATCRKNFSQWESSFLWKLRCHWLKFLRSVAKMLVIQGPVPSWTRWRHRMKTVSASLALCAGNSSVTGEFPHKGQWRGALIFSLICPWISGWANNREACNVRRHRGPNDVTVMDAIRGLCLPCHMG